MPLEQSKESIYELLLKENSTFSTESSKCSLNILLVAHEFHLKLETLFRNFELNNQRFSLLLALKFSPKGLVPSEIAKLARVSRATATQYVDCLVRKGLADRTNSRKDRRFLFIRLTRKGNQTLNRVLPLHKKTLENFTSALSAPERRDLITLLSNIRSGIQR